LRVEISGEYRAGIVGRFDDLNSGSEIFLPEDNWGAAVETDCLSDFPVQKMHTFWIYPDLGMLSPPPWSSSFGLTICPNQ